MNYEIKYCIVKFVMLFGSGQTNSVFWLLELQNLHFLNKIRSFVWNLYDLGGGGGANGEDVCRCFDSWLSLGHYRPSLQAFTPSIIR